MELYNYLILLDYLINKYAWSTFELLIVLLWIFLVKRLHLPIYFSIICGLVVLFLVMIFVVFGNDAIAGKMAELMFLFFLTYAVHAFVKRLNNNEE